MGILSKAVLALALGKSVVEGTVLDGRQDTKTGKYCDSTQRNVCYSESTATTSGTVFRIAIPEVAKAPFDTLVQVVAPVSVGWAGIAWGGSMSQNPLTVVWMNGNQGVVSSRWATGHTPPAAYAGASYSVLSSTKDASHWTVNFLCTGCSTWGTASLDPNGVNKIGYATSSKAPDTPASNTSSIGIHSEKGGFSHDLGMGKVDSNAFRRFVLFLSTPATAPSPSTSATSVAPPVNPPVNPPTQRTSSTRIPTTIIHASPTEPQTGPVATRPSTSSASSKPPSTVGRTTTSSSVRTIITTVSRPTTVRTTSSRPVTVTVTVTQPPAVTTSRARPTATTSCYRRVGRPYRYCTTNPDEGDDDEGDDEGYDGWN